MRGKLHLEKLIKRYDLVETEHRMCNNKVMTVVLDSYENYLEIKQVEEYFSHALMAGDELYCKYTTRELIHLFTTEVYNVKFASRSVVLKVYDIKTMENNRRFKRYDAYLCGSYGNKDTAGENYCVIANVSTKGLSIITRNTLEMDDEINVSIYLSGFNFLMARCSVRWFQKFDKNNMYGLAITGMDEISKAQYITFIRKLQVRENNLKKKGEKLLGLYNY
jgi:hypothetical protein